MVLFIKEFFEKSLFWEKISRQQNSNQHYPACKDFFKSVSLKCVLERCETAIKTNGHLYKHLKLGVSPNLLKVLN